MQTVDENLQKEDESQTIELPSVTKDGTENDLLIFIYTMCFMLVNL